MTSARKVKPLPNMDEKKHKIIDWLGSSHGLPLKNTTCLLKVSDIETEAPPSLPLPANPYRSYNISCYVEQRVSRYAHYMEDVGAAFAFKASQPMHPRYWSWFHQRCKNFEGTRTPLYPLHILDHAVFYVDMLDAERMA